MSWGEGVSWGDRETHPRTSAAGLVCVTDGALGGSQLRNEKEHQLSLFTRIRNTRFRISRDCPRVALQEVNELLDWYEQCRSASCTRALS